MCQAGAQTHAPGWLGISISMQGSDYQVEVGVVVVLPQEFADHYVHPRRTADPHTRYISLAHFILQNVLEPGGGEANIAASLHLSLRVLPELQRQLHPPPLGQEQHLLEGDQVHVVDVREGSQHLEAEIFEGVGGQDGTDAEDLLPGRRAGLHELLLVEEVDEVAEGVDACSAGHQDDSAGLGVGQLESLPFGAADEQFVDGALDDGVGELTSGVAFEHDGDAVGVAVDWPLGHGSHLDLGCLTAFAS
jgi:hypothetical protein